MIKSRYYLNPETLRYEKVRYPLKKKFFGSFYIFLGILIIAGFLRIAFDRVADSPKAALYAERNKELKLAYEFLIKDIRRAENLLTELQKRDEKLYRSVLNLDPVPASIRDAGFGGSENYINVLMSRSDELVVSTAKQLEKLVNKVKIQSVSLHDLNDIAKKQRDLIAGRPSLNPISPGDQVWITSTYGYRFDPFTKRRTMHHGIDFAGNTGIKIYATGDGKVIDANLSPYGYGKEVYIDHGFGYSSRYAHLQKIHVKPGQMVKRGEHIGDLGSSGRSTGPHLHYEVYHNGVPRNPMYFYFENLSPDEYGEIIAQANK
jgi:murein DD-endopeptidase MepM/ murein hydrolase activator NlpD